MNIKRVFDTVRYMNSRQLIYRLRYEISKKISRSIEVKGDFEVNQNYKFRNKEFVTGNNDILLDANRILNNEFTFLNKLTYKFENEVDWEINPFDYRLWNFNLNYFDFLDTLYNTYKKTKDIKYLDKGINLIDNWIEKNKEYNVNTWDPYVVSKRLFNFINFIADIKEIYIIDKLDKINSNIYTQAQYLSRNIEYYLDANHVIMDGKGLVFAGTYLNNSSLLNQGISILEKEYKRQVLSDGGHYERSPSYQVEVLSHYVESYILLIKNGLNEKGKILIKPIEKMSGYLNSIIMPNGNIPLLNDSSLDYPFKAEDLLQVCSIILKQKLFYSNSLSDYALSILDSQDVNIFNELIKCEKYSSIKNVILEESGYYIIKDLINNEEIYILFDCGNGGPDYNLGHTHADSLNILLTIGNRDLIIDSGTYTYKIGQDRDNYRSTLAHNTITIDNKNSSDIWSGFRVGKRAKTTLNKYIDNNKYTYISASHDGYRKILTKDKIIHKREVIYIKGNGLIIIDTLAGKIKNKHSAIINYNLQKDYFKSDTKKLFTENNILEFQINNNFEIIKDKYSDMFNIEKECNKIRANWNFDKESSKITSFIFNDIKLNINIDDNKIQIIRNGQIIIDINR